MLLLLTHCCVSSLVGHLRQKYQWASLWTWQEPWNLLLCRWVVKALTSWTSFCLIKHHSRDTNLWSCDILTFSSAPVYFLSYFFNFLLKPTGLFLGMLSDNICWVFMVPLTAGGKENKSWEINLDYRGPLTYCLLHRPALIPNKMRCA